jgi:hypothetical protein
MATKLNTFDFKPASAITTGEKAVYPWEEWLDGDIWQIEEHEDFETHPLMMERIIRTRATARHAKVRLRHVASNGKSPFGIIVLQRTDVKGPAASKKAEQAEKRAAKKAAAQAEAQEIVKNLKPAPSKKAAAKAVIGDSAKVTKKAVSKRPAKPSKAAAK